ncbi:hypothetical protein Ancab_038691 [Ancistrocladus abbreviatus]
MEGYDLDFSDSDTDDLLLQDIQALASACMPSTSNPNDNHKGSPDATNTTNAAVGDSADAPVDWSDSDDDFGLLRSIQQSYACGSDINQPLSLKPVSTLPPVSSDDEEDDFETLRAIQRRFSQYCGDTRGNEDSSDTHNQQDFEVGIPLDNEMLGGRFVDRVDANGDVCGATQNAEASGGYLSGDNERCSREFNQFGGDGACGFQFQNSNLPKSALAFVNAIKKNRLCQKFIRSNMIHVEARIEQVEELKKRVGILKMFQVQCKKKIGRAVSNKQDARVQLISTAKHRADLKDTDKRISALSCGPQENSHVANYKMALTKFPHSFQRENWSKEEKDNLVKGIIQQYQASLLANSVDKLSRSEALSFPDELDDLMSQIRDLEMTPEMIRKFLPQVNWEQLASMYVSRHSAAECEARWLNFEDRLINNAEWNTLEDKKLLLIVQQKGLNNWIDIAVSLATNRTPFQCLKRYQGSLNASIIKREWTADEDALLCSAVEAFGESNWQAVASTIEGRTGTQCSNRWKKTLHPTIERKGNWTQDEDKCLKVSVTVIGPKNWPKIAQFVPGRTQVQCRERWVNCLDPSLIMGKWTEEDDLKLQAAIAEHGYCWAKVAACLHPRTDNQCRRRWKVLFPHEVPLLQAARDIQRAALISNFVDRERLRPALGPKDFVLPLLDSVPREENVNVSQKRRKSRTRREAVVIGEMAFCHIPKKLRSKRRRRVTYEEITVMHGCSVFESVGEDDTLLNRKKRANRSRSKKNRCAEVLQDQSSCFHSTLLSDGKEVAVSTVARPSGVDVTLSNRKRRAKGSRLRRNKHADILQDQRSCVDPSMSAGDKEAEACSAVGALGVDDTLSTGKRRFCSKINTYAEMLPDQFSCLESILSNNGEQVEASSLDVLANKEMSEEQAKRRVFAATTQAQQSSIWSSENLDLATTNGDGIKTYGGNEAVSSMKRIASRQQRKRKLHSDESEEWDKLTLADLFGEAVTRIKKKIRCARKSSW